MCSAFLLMEISWDILTEFSPAPCHSALLTPVFSVRHIKLREMSATPS